MQGKWLYLESIFKGQGQDIGKQLPKEQGQFLRINDKFKTEMTRIYKEKNCYNALIVNDADFIKTL